jgi:geranylgeranyl diphosphate synthase type II
MEKLKGEFDLFLKLFLDDNPKFGDCFDGGKRLRPILVMEVASFINPLWRTNQKLAYKIRRFGLALEIIHNTSLIIDDLPSMDNDMYRRGNLSFHAKNGQHSSYLMVYNLLALIKKIIMENDDETVEYLELEELINQEMSNLVLGQQYDLDEKWKPSTGSRTLKIAELKTASLFKLALITPYYLLSPKEQNDFIKKNNFTKQTFKNNLLSIGENLGIAFQLSDDFIDIDEDSDNKFNNYGIETSKTNLVKKYIHYCDLVIKKMEKLNWKQNSPIYEIIMLMNKRFLE